MIRRLHTGLGIPLASLLGVADEAPAGYIRVDWLLPEGVVREVSSKAAEEGLKVEEVVAPLLSETTSAAKDVHVMTDLQTATAPRATTFTPGGGPLTPRDRRPASPAVA